MCICLLILCIPGRYWFYKHISCRPAPHLHLLANSLHPQLVLVLQSTYHVGVPQICIPLQVFCNPGRYWFYRHISCRPAPHLHLLANSLHPAGTGSTKHISCWPAPHLHPLANSLYPRPVWVLQTHLMSACPTFASPCWFFAPPAGTGSTNTSHVSLHHICISLPTFCTPGQCGFYKHIPNRPEPHLHSLAMLAGTSSMDS